MDKLGYQGRTVFRPVSMLYFLILLLSFVMVITMILLLIGDLLASALGIPPQWVSVFLFVSLFGSFMNIPVATLESRVPIMRAREVSVFGVTWQVPSIGFGVTRTRVMVNLGGAVLPVITSAYLLISSIHSCSPNPMNAYLSIATVLLIVTVFVNRSARVVGGFGIATPALVPPLITALSTILIDYVFPLSCPAQIAYIGGTLGTLVGADLLNMHMVQDIGAPVVSIGGAGTFDGIYLTGLVSVLLIILLL